MPWYRRWRKAQRETIGEFRQLLIHVLHDLLILRLPAGPLLPIVERHKEESRIAGANKAQEAETRYSRCILHSGRAHQDFFHLGGRRFRALQRSCVGKLEVHEHVAP